ncbi:MAG: twin-arginine translocation signal domain-containing protein, partial [Planctomycetaceae bacterium]|nr:twin-arginine translocation signal domain-containing protein [Planctomycetaceae bacterium]
MKNLSHRNLSRRNFLKAAGAVGAYPLLSSLTFGNTATDTVRDRLWLWGHIEGSYDNQYGLPNKGHSRLTPPQAAEYIGIPNIIFIRYGKKPVPPYDEYAEQYRNTKKLMWSFVGDSSSGTSAEEQEHVLELAKKMPNITGLFMDDFFHKKAEPIAGPDSEAAASITVARLREIRKKMEQMDRRIDLNVVLYTHQLNPAIQQHLDLCDVVSFWSWTAKELEKLPENFAKYQEIA